MTAREARNKRLETHCEFWTSELAAMRQLDEPELAADIRSLLADEKRLREALSEEAVDRYLTEQCGWSLEWDGHYTTRTAVVSTLRCFARAALSTPPEEGR